jgi:outer membrane protein OmpA-like peptidoglycan-associated protein
LSTSAISAQQVPIYQITVTERTVESVNYQYRKGPTRVDFRGTVLLPDAKGEAIVESKSGRTDVQLKFDRVAAPTRFGTEYLTYVVWAISPEGHAKNLGEVLTDGGEHARLQVTSDLQAFGMIVTAEPYSAVRQPSDVVVMENVIRPDTVGNVEPIRAKYELLPRGYYTYVKPANLGPPEGAKVSMAEYESLLELYQAQNAIQIAQSQEADRYAADTFSKAQDLLRQARDMQARKADSGTVVSIARQAAQTAEDARAITIKRKQEAEIADARRAANEAEARRVAAEQSAREARIEASADRMRLEEGRADRLAAVAAAPAPPLAAPVPALPTAITRRPGDAGEKDLRAALLRELSGIVTTTDTPRGLVVLLPDGDFRNAELDGQTSARVARIATVLASQGGLDVRVEGYMDASGLNAEDLSYRRAVSVRAALVRGGIARDAVNAQGFGGARPIVSNASPGGRLQNRRVEIVISGDSIGTVPTWDRTYSLR